ncbi:hypothetical protein RND81_08G096700 [Saponaria officinalis]|uniref:Uncharacterized protein n=1 Tax=Saponaria officinalis TaxID=3572 RepID=A0AAW1J6B3_SAPOF
MCLPPCRTHPPQHNLRCASSTTPQTRYCHTPSICSLAWSMLYSRMLRSLIRCLQNNTHSQTKEHRHSVKISWNYGAMIALHSPTVDLPFDSIMLMDCFFAK